MSDKNVVIFEDELYGNFNPLALTRPTYDLICGMNTIWKSIMERFYPGAKVSFVCRDYLKAVFKQKVNAKVNDLSGLASALFINGRTLAALSELPPVDGDSEMGLQDKTIVFARLNANEISSLAGSISDNPKDFVDKLASIDIPKGEVKGIKLANYIWELIRHNAEAIGADFKLMGKPEESLGIIEKGAYVRIKSGKKIKVLNSDKAKKLMLDGEINLHVGKGARIFTGVTIDITGGPVYIGDYADVRPPTLIDGPCCIMSSPGKPKQTTIIDGALMRSGSTLGPVCRVGGELEESIIQGFSNKHHAGFIGHAYLGEWVNIGAMATNSDLKNDMSDVKVPINGQLLDSNDLKVGSFLGDHVKLGIGALLTTGTVVGIMTNVLASGSIPPQYIPSFCFYREDRLSVGFRPKTFIEIAERVMIRRNVKQTPEDVELLEKVLKIIKEDRDNEIEKQNRVVDNAIFKIIRQWNKEQSTQG
jgi:UDP-N-acetylglucosamine diphosphorylase/glucosamine-1-phosphate N-acetyltransferase